MKSPIYGGGRNRKHRPKNKPIFHACAGGINMKGKKEKVASCNCCVCLDLRDKARKRDIGRGVEQ